MKRIEQQTYGGPEVLQVVEVPAPTAAGLAEGEVLVRVAFAALNPVDAKSRAGGAVAELLGPLPVTLGWDLAGTVEAGALRAGTRVMALSRFPHQAAAYAQYAVVPVADLVVVPDGVTDEAAAALPMAALTAWQAMAAAGIAAGQRVLVHGAGGGVGHLAVQIAHHLGAQVTVTASAGKHAWLTGLGADVAIDYRDTDVVAALAGSPVDLVLDLVAGAGPTAVAVTRPGGIVIEIPDGVSEQTRAAAAAAGVRTTGHYVHPDAPLLARIADLAAAGTLAPTISAVHPLADVVTAHRSLDEGHAKGKILLQMW